MTRIYLIRHGLGEGLEGCAVGHWDPPLSTSGSEAMRRLGATWEGPAPDALYASDLKRAAQSAHLLALAWGSTVKLDPRLREIGFGEWEGKAWQEIHERDTERFKSWSSEWWLARPPGGENYSDLEARALQWIEEVGSRPSNRTIVAVAHGGSIRVLLAHALGLAPEEIFQLRLDHAHVSGLVRRTERVELLFGNLDRFPPPSDI